MKKETQLGIFHKGECGNKLYSAKKSGNRNISLKNLGFGTPMHTLIHASECL